MEAKANYKLVGFIVIILSIGLFAMILWLSVGLDKNSYKIYAVYMNEAVAGLSQDSVVKYNGVQVGTVKQISLSNADPRKVEILLKIESSTPVTVSTTATLMSQGITGTSYIGLSASSGDLTPLQRKPKQPYPIIPAKPSLFNQVDRVLKEVSDNINMVSVRLQSILDEENVSNLKKTIKNLNLVSQTLANHRQDLSHSIKNADRLLHNLAKVSQNLPELSLDLKHTLHKMSQDLAEVGLGINTAMNAGKIALNKFSTETLPPAILLLQHLNRLATTWENISLKIKENPSVVIRGTRPSAKGPGES